MLVDSHCHLDFPEFSGKIDEILGAMARNGVSHALCVSVTLEGFPVVLGLAKRHGNLFASVGVHPDNAGCEEPDVASLAELAGDDKVVAIGETGLDYYWHKDAPEWQRQRFRVHIQAAREVGKPLIVHTRDAAADTLRIMREEGAKEAGGVMHCFTESQEVAEQAMAMGFYISFSGIVTFKNAVALKETAKAVPLSHLLVETDAPYLAPAPYRGKTNQPAYVLHVAQEIARLHGTTVEQVAQATTRNFFTLFKGARP